MKSLHNFLFVALFSLMSLYWTSASAQSCTGTAVNSCSGINASSSTCGGYYLSNGSGGGTQCKWNGDYCSNGGSACGSQPSTPPSPPAPPPPSPTSSNPTIVGTLTWEFHPVMSYFLTPCKDFYCSTYYLYFMTLTPVYNGNNSYSLSGHGQVSAVERDTGRINYYEVPGYGSMFLAGNYYSMMIESMVINPSTGESTRLSLSCELDSATLSGPCRNMPADGQKSVSAQAVLYKY